MRRNDFSSFLNLSITIVAAIECKPIILGLHEYFKRHPTIHIETLSLLLNKESHLIAWQSW
jgi:hypothetical protein